MPFSRVRSLSHRSLEAGHNAAKHAVLRASRAIVVARLTPSGGGRRVAGCWALSGARRRRTSSPPSACGHCSCTRTSTRRRTPASASRRSAAPMVRPSHLTPGAQDGPLCDASGGMGHRLSSNRGYPRTRDALPITVDSAEEQGCDFVCRVRLCLDIAVQST